MYICIMVNSRCKVNYMVISSCEHEDVVNSAIYQLDVKLLVLPSIKRGKSVGCLTLLPAK